jgi:hypothetical protein
MKDQFLHKKFIFNGNIDESYLYSLYEDDFLYIEEIFKTTLDQLNPLMSEIPVAFDKKETEKLRKIIHKIKPAFGFTGFLATEKACKEFEDSCSTSTNITDLAPLFPPLWKLISESRNIMEQQYNQLKEFNTK